MTKIQLSPMLLLLAGAVAFTDGMFSQWHSGRATTHQQDYSIRSRQDDTTTSDSNSLDDVCPSPEGKKFLWLFETKNNRSQAGKIARKDGNNNHRAIQKSARHQTDHRTKENTPEKVANQMAKKSEQQAEDLAERASSRIERTFEKLVEKAAKASGERSIERVSERAVERVSERAGERFASKTAVKAGKRATERSGMLHWLKKSFSPFYRGIEGTGERSSERFVERSFKAGSRVVERSGERLKERGIEAGSRAIKTSGEHLTERGIKVGSQAAERSGERLVERGIEAGSRAAKRSGERLAERGLEAGERVIERSGERLAERGIEVASRAIERSSERITVGSATKASGRGPIRAVERIFGASSEKIMIRFGRGVLITLPILGGIFALYLLKTDIERLKEEWQSRLKTSSALFLGAGIVDGLDSLLHFFIAFALFRHLDHRKMGVAEELSFACAIISTVCAIVGEIVSIKLQKRKEILDGNI